MGNVGKHEAGVQTFCTFISVDNNLLLLSILLLLLLLKKNGFLQRGFKTALALLWITYSDVEFWCHVKKKTSDLDLANHKRVKSAHVFGCVHIMTAWPLPTFSLTPQQLTLMVIF